MVQRARGLSFGELRQCLDDPLAARGSRRAWRRTTRIDVDPRALARREQRCNSAVRRHFVAIRARELVVADLEDRPRHAALTRPFHFAIGWCALPLVATSPSVVRVRGADGLETEPRKRAIQRAFLVAQGGIELPTRGFSKDPDPSES